MKKPHTQFEKHGNKIFTLPEIIDPRGTLTVCDLNGQFPFTAKRLFLVHGVPVSESRGQHAHRSCHQFLICLSGSVTAMVDDGQHREFIRLDRPGIGLHMPPMTWGTQSNFTEGATLLVMASDLYDPEDYIRNYDEFLVAKLGPNLNKGVAN